MGDRKPSADEVAEFVQSAFKLERLRQDLEAGFQVVSHLPEDLDLPAQRAVLAQARVTLGRAALEERQTTAEQARQAPRIRSHIAELDSAPPPPAWTPTPVAPGPSAPAPQSGAPSPFPAYAQGGAPFQPVLSGPPPSGNWQKKENTANLDSAVRWAFQADLESNIAPIARAPIAPPPPPPEAAAPAPTRSAEAGKPEEQLPGSDEPST